MAPWPWLLATGVAFLVGRWSRGNVDCPMPSPALDTVDAEVLPHLYSPPRGHGRVEVPSTVSDARGSVHNLLIGGFRFNVLVSHAGTKRSGDVHQSRQLDMLFSGHVKVTTREGGRDVSRLYSSGQMIVIPAHTPHIFHFLNETVMAEWWDGPFECRYYRPYRKLVDKALREAAAAAADGRRLSHPQVDDPTPPRPRRVLSSVARARKR